MENELFCERRINENQHKEPFTQSNTNTLCSGQIIYSVVLWKKNHLEINDILLYLKMTILSTLMFTLCIKNKLNKLKTVFKYRRNETSISVKISRSKCCLDYKNTEQKLFLINSL